jgi:hypothetical protein
MMMHDGDEAVYLYRDTIDGSGSALVPTQIEEVGASPPSVPR